MTLQELLQAMRQKYPGKDWDIENNQLLFSHDGYAIWNPTAGIPDWIEVDSLAEYGIEHDDANLIHEVNLAHQSN